MIAHRELNQLSRAYSGVVGLYIVAVIVLFALGLTFQLKSEEPEGYRNTTMPTLPSPRNNQAPNLPNTNENNKDLGHNNS